jgi:hypothetical protein
MARRGKIYFFLEISPSPFPTIHSSMTRRVVVSHIQRLCDLALDGFGGFQPQHKTLCGDESGDCFWPIAVPGGSPLSANSGRSSSSSRQHQSLFPSFKKWSLRANNRSSMSRQAARELGDAELQPVFRLLSHVPLEMIKVLRSRWMLKYGPATF